MAELGKSDVNFRSFLSPERPFRDQNKLSWHTICTLLNSDDWRKKICFLIPALTQRNVLEKGQQPDLKETK